ncbi:unnamed protein product [Musa acuminata subsp. malaccensis]|uniref:(wild Malaysian banana) hypothetical protein n=1 Tax=Musa acuminata subsp. malaccensis TaxID=214687 RepID=A0A804L440_MUSAM|nr:unnamed protein product [Musa acuminata subsp. malaccensis]
MKRHASKSIRSWKHHPCILLRVMISTSRMIVSEGDGTLLFVVRALLRRAVRAAFLLPFRSLSKVLNLMPC